MYLLEKRVIVHIFTVNVHILTVNVHVLTVNVHILTVNVYILTVNVHVLTVNVHALTVNIIHAFVHIYLLKKRMNYKGNLFSYINHTCICAYISTGKRGGGGKDTYTQSSHTHTCAQVSVMAVNYKGRPFMLASTENKPMGWSLLAVCVGVFVCAFEVFPWFNDLLKLVPLPSQEFRSRVSLLCVCVCVCVLCMYTTKK
jgi:threonine/homoserine efflux transporter RhtA